MTRRTLFFLSLSGLAGCSRESRPRLNVYNWSEYVAEDTIPNFEREFGVTARYGIYESNEEMLAKVLTGNSGWDVVFPSNYILRPMLENNLLQPLDHSKLSLIGNLRPPFQRPEWDPDLRYSLPYMSGASGILFHQSVDPPVRAWSDLWEQRLSGRMTMLDDPVEVIGASLKKLGYSLNSTNEPELRAAQKEAIQQKKLLRAYLNAEVRDQLVSGDVRAAQLWATTSQQAIDADSQLNFVYPEEGYALYCDNAVILRESSREELAHKFLNYLLRPDVAAKIVGTSRCSTTNAKTLELLPAETRDNPTMFPGPDLLARGEWFKPMPAEAQRLRDRIWTEIKSS